MIVPLSFDAFLIFLLFHSSFATLWHNTFTQLIHETRQLWVQYDRYGILCTALNRVFYYIEATREDYDRFGSRQIQSNIAQYYVIRVNG